jgi:hypothetical protein
MLLANHKKILQDIINLNGDCLDSNRCSVCPFAYVCLIEFAKNASDPKTRIASKQDRLNIALNILMRDALMNDVDDPKDHFVTGKKL